ncbi:hypothetical protein NGRA_0059 [Nosema granulosis]|uniref:Amino acid transporter transmembrane domain-containing protein n=1 Tax=Nosema granulosis TaxID=83296 RepID=A0A9P6H218_9MICR|nr:hypothetical protein NGRA_0059 [Nosema granulosis]
MKQNLSTFEAIISVVTSMFGIGIMFTPYSFSQSGPLVGGLILLGVQVLTIISMAGLLFCSKQYNKKLEEAMRKKLERTNNYLIGLGYTPTQEELERVEPIPDNQVVSYSRLVLQFNPFVSRVIEVLIPLGGIATCLFYQKYICVLATTLLGYNEKNEDFYYVYAEMIGLSSFYLYFLSQIEDLARLKYVSFISVLCMSTVGVFIMVLNFLMGNFIKQHSPNENKGDMAFVIGNFIFALFCQNNTVNLFTKLTDITSKSLLIISISSTIISGTIYFTVGFMGSRLFGEHMVKKDIMSIFADSKSPINVILDQEYSLYLLYIPKILCVLAIVVLSGSFPLQLSPVTVSLSSLGILSNFKRRTKTFIITTLLFALIVGLNLIPNIGLDVVISLISSLSCNFLAFLFPFGIVIYYFGKKHQYVVTTSLLIMLSSTIYAVFSVFSTFSGIINQDTPAMLSNETETIIQN